MKRWVLVLFMVISLSGCKGNKEILTKHSISFLTSEYYFDGEKYYKVREGEKLRELMDRVRDYYQMEEDEFILEIVDNGCEARNVLVIKNKDEEAYIEGVYEIVSRSYEDECLVLTLKTGDYYSHESIRTYIVTLNNGKIEVRDGE